MRKRGEAGGWLGSGARIAGSSSSGSEGAVHILCRQVNLEESSSKLFCLDQITSKHSKLSNKKKQLYQTAIINSITKIISGTMVLSGIIKN